MLHTRLKRLSKRSIEGSIIELLGELRNASSYLSKATLRLLGVEYPRQHEVSDLLRRISVERGLPEWFLLELPAIILVSKRLVENRGPAFYGDEAAFAPPRNLYAKEDAEKAVSDAENVLKICRNLFDWWKAKR